MEYCKNISTRKIAEITGKKHQHVLRDVRMNLVGKGKIEGVSESFYIHTQNGQKYIEYILDLKALSILNQWYRDKNLGAICNQEVLSNTTRFEVSFGNILIPMLKELEIDVETQFRIGNYRIDFYIPKLNIAIEYDESQHNNKRNIKEDKIREQRISEILGCTFIRLDYRNSDAANVGIVLSKIVKIK